MSPHSDDRHLVTAYVFVGQEKHTGTHGPGRRGRVAAGIREWLCDWGCKYFFE